MLKNLVASLVLIIPTATLSAYLGAQLSKSPEPATGNGANPPEAQTKVIERVIIQRPEAVSQPDQAPVPEAPSPQPEPADAPRPTPAERVAAFRELKSDVLTEARDASWARSTEPQIREAFETELSQIDGDAVLEKVECGSTRCVVEMTTSSNDFDEGSFPRLMKLGLGRVNEVKLADGSTRYEVIGARDGYGLYGEELASR